MIICASKVDMSANRQYISYSMEKSASITQRGDKAVKLDLSEEAKSLSEQLAQQKREERESAKQKERDSVLGMLESERAKGASYQDYDPGEQTDYKIDMLKQLLRALRDAMRKYGKGNMPDTGWIDESIDRMEERQRRIARSAYRGFSIGISASSSFSAAVAIGGGAIKAAAAGASNVLVKTSVTSGIRTEAEFTSFEGKGVALTADGRTIDFNVSLDMSRAFCEKYETFKQETETIKCTDPLVINVDAGCASVSDMKFKFDLDSDGNKEDISFVGEGSGFLALDKNGDGKINDGSELFGTKSGDGFKDLSKYDEDGNGWIDEADSVFKDLKVWMKDENGQDVLIDLKKADVGAIYLGNADTQFSLKGEAHNTNAIIRKTGLFLKESGGVGTVQHLDLAV